MSNSRKGKARQTGQTRGAHTEGEISSQPIVWRDSLAGLGIQISSLPLDWRSCDHVLLVGCGSTYYLALWAGSLIQSQWSGRAEAIPSSEVVLFPEQRLPRDGRTLLVAVSRSGETQETLRSVEYFSRRRIGKTLAITCYPDRRLAHITDMVLSTPTAQEESVVQTRSFTSMMLAMATFIDGGIPPDLGDRLQAAGQQLLDTHAELAAMLGAELSLSHIVTLGSGPLFGLACEAALKLKEMSLTTSESYHTLEVRHGPMSMVGAHTLIVALLTREARQTELRVLSDLKSLGATTLAISDYDLSDSPHFIDHHVQLPSDLPPFWRDPLYLVVPHLLALERTRAKGLDPDRPPNLTAVVRSV